MLWSTKLFSSYLILPPDTMMLLELVSYQTACDVSLDVAATIAY
jgi:hypothetical protein